MNPSIIYEIPWLETACHGPGRKKVILKGENSVLEHFLGVHPLNGFPGQKWLATAHREAVTREFAKLEKALLKTRSFVLKLWEPILILDPIFVTA